MKQSTTSGSDVTFSLTAIIIRYKIFNLDDNTNENHRGHNTGWLFALDHRYRIIIIGGSGSGKKNALLNLIKEQDDIDKICLYAKYLSEPKCKFLIKKRDAGTKHLNDPNAFIE